MRLLPSRTAVVPALALVAALLGATTATAAPLVRTPVRAIEGFAPYQPQTTCSPTAKPGTVALRTLIMQAYGGTGDYGIIRNCASGGRSEHKEGRAWDWKVSAGNAAQVRQVNDMLKWVFATDRYGNSYAQARRLGIMYIIWNHRIWNASNHTWKPYSGADAHTTHVHFSLGWAGALKRTSYWTGRVSPVVAAPKAPAAPAPSPAPKPAPTPVPKPVPVGPQPLTRATVIRVPATTPKPTVSSFLAVAGTRYLVKAAGTYIAGVDRLADAECSQLADGTWSRRPAEERDSRDSELLDLQVNGVPTRWATPNGERCDAVGHTYWTVIEPTTTGRMSFKVVDSGYSDNHVFLTVTVSPLGQASRH